MNVWLGTVAEYVQHRYTLEQRAAEAIRVVPLPSQESAPATGTLLLANAGNILGPNTGYAWAVQSLSVAGLATGDTASLYIGPAVAATVQPNNFVQQFTPSAPSWQPGRTGLVLNPGDTLVLAGSSLTSTLVTLTGRVIIMELWLLPEFLL